MKYEKTNIKKGIALLLSAVMFGTTLFVYNPLQTNATETTVQGDHDGNGECDVSDLVGWVDADKSSSDDANSLRTELLRIVDTSVENDDGTFEGNTGNVSIYNTKMIKGYNYQYAAAMDFESIPAEEGGQKIHIKGKGEKPKSTELLYFKFDQPVEKSVTYTVSMDLEAKASDYINGYWRYSFVYDTNSVGTIHDIAKQDETKAKELFKNGYTFSFTATANHECFYLAFLESGDVRMDFTIDNIKLDITYPITTSVEGDDGTFEGKSGEISIYNTKLIEGYNHKYSAAIDFQRVQTEDGGQKLHIKGKGKNPKSTELLYIKFNQPVIKGVTYMVRMDLGAMDNEYGNGVWKYNFVYDTTTVGSLKTENAEVFFRNGCTLSFTATDNHDCFYLAFCESGDIRMNFTIDNIEVITNAVVNDDGSFEGKNGNVSLYSIAALSGVNGHATANGGDIVTFKRVKTTSGSAMLIQSEDKPNTTTGGMVYIKFTQKLTANMEYTINYDAKWTGDKLPTARQQYAIVQSVDKWITSANNPIVSIASPKTGSMFDGTASVTFTPTEDYSEFYLVLYLDSNQPHFDMQIDNIIVTEKLVTE